MDKQKADEYAYKTLSLLIEKSPEAFAFTLPGGMARGRAIAEAMDAFVETFSAAVLKRTSPVD